jgi:hypothetical protein
MTGTKKSATGLTTKCDESSGTIKKLEPIVGSEIKPEGLFFVHISDIILPQNLDKPTPIPLKFILNQYHRGTCDPIILTPENVLVDGIYQYKVGKLLKWKKIRAIFEDNKKDASPSDLSVASETMKCD